MEQTSDDCTDHPSVPRDPPSIGYMDETLAPTMESSQGRKVPATTARRKGLYMARVRSTSRSSSSDPTSGSLSRTRKREKTTNNIMEGDAHDVDNDPSSEDFDYEPTELSEEDNSQDQTDMETDVEDGFLFQGAEDGFEPDTGDAWDVDNKSYLDKIYANGEIYGDNDFGKIKITEWMMFLNKQHFVDALRDYCIQEGFAMVVTKSCRRRFTAICRDANCDWRIHSAKLLDKVTWVVKSLNDTHNCSRLTLDNPMATPQWAAGKIIEDVRANAEIDGKAINKLLCQRYGINLKTTSLYKARSIAVESIKGDEDGSYDHLPTYCEIVQRKNPGSKAHCVWRIAEEVPEKPIQFKSIYISFKPMIDGFIRGCRGLIGVDGCHLKGKYGGVLLSAIALDGNNEIFPIAYGIYENESKNTWSNFFSHLQDSLKDANRDNLAIVSDRQKGVEPALGEIWPTVSRRFCCRHLCSNFKKSYPGRLMHNLFWACCKAYSAFTFKKAIENLQNSGGLGAVKWIKDLGDQERWARHKYDPTLCSPETTSNFVESFNSTLGEDRSGPVLTLLEGIRRTCMVRHYTRKEEASRLPTIGITKDAQRILKLADKKSRRLLVYPASTTSFEVKDDQLYLPVNIEARTCACGQWQIDGIPCRHAVRVLSHLRQNPEAYVSEWYSLDMYRRTYSVDYISMPDVEQWCEEQLGEINLPKIKPPPMKRGIGRPARNRRREEGEKRKGKRTNLLRCGKCKAFGHNVKTCKGGLTARELKEQQGIRVEQRQKKKRKVCTNVDQQEQAEITRVPDSQDGGMGSAPWIPGTQY